MERVILRLGWEPARQTGSHRHFTHPDHPGRIVTIPFHRGGLKIGTQRSIMKQAGITAEQLQELL